jgi:hypothetical protein
VLGPLPNADGLSSVDGPQRKEADLRPFPRYKRSLPGLKELKLDVVGAQDAKQGTELVDLLEGHTPRDIDKLVARLSEVPSDQLAAGSPRKQSVNTSMFSKSWLVDVF